MKSGAGCHRRLLQILSKPNRTPEEQRVFDAMAAIVKAMHVKATEESLRLYNQWAFAPHLFVPPPPFAYSRPAPPNFGLFHLFGGPEPPSPMRVGPLQDDAQSAPGRAF